MKRWTRVLPAILARIAAHMFPRAQRSEFSLGMAYHMARVRIEAHRLEDAAENIDPERMRKRQAIGDRIVQGYSRSRSRKLTRVELGDGPRMVAH